VKQIWVRAAPSGDPALIGKEIVSKPEPGPRRLFTSTPELVDLTPQIMRMLAHGDLIEVDAPAPAEDNKE
jgi:hypothetical protein